MAKPYTKKEVVYYINNDKEAIDELRANLYDTYESVLVTPNGLHETRIICTNN